MKPGAPRAPVGRADLLIHLRLRPDAQWLELDEGGAAAGAAWGYEKQGAKEPIPPPPDDDDDRPPPPPPRPPTLRRLPLRMPFAWNLALEAPPDAVADQPLAPSVKLGPLRRPKRADQRSEKLRIDRNHAPVAQGARVGHLLASSASASRKIDWRITVQQVARGRVPDPLPVQRNSSWRGHVHIVLDAWAPSMWPFALDLDVIRSQIQARLGQFNTTLHWLPAMDGTDPAASAAQWPGLDRVGGTWLVLTDAGIAEPSGGRAKAFEQWAQQMTQRNHRMLWMAPLPGSLLSCLPAAGWAASWEHTRLRRVRRQPDVAASVARHALEHPAVHQVLGMLAMMDGSGDALLLRGLRGLVAPRETSVDWLVWNHPHVTRHGSHCRLRPEHLDEHKACLPQIPAALLNRAVQIQRRVQAGLSGADAHVNMLNAVVAEPELRAAWANEVAHAQAYPSALHAQGLSQQGSALLQWRLQALRFLAAASVAVRVENRVAFTALAQQALQDSLARGEDVPLFPGLNPLRGGSAPSGTQSGSSWSLVQDGMAVWLRQDGPSRVGAVLTEQWASASSDDGVWLEKGASGRWLAPIGAGVCVVAADVLATETRLTLAGSKATLRPVRRPAWANRFGQATGKIICQIELPWGAVLNMTPEAAEQRNELPDGGWAGLDANGLYLDLLIEQKRGFFPLQEKRQRLRLRYIPPGTFLMGSPDGEGDSDERPQHPVTITQGFWLAEAPCTQALWQAVMGANPSHFQQGEDAPNRPVENVSHEDVQTFLRKLQTLLPEGTQADLPTEAEWEYACRADTRTAYWWGDEFDPARANTYHTGKKQYGDREGTTPVDRYPPNPWGLYDMHGNVWEWCADYRRDYTAESAVDPRGPESKYAFVVRGGSSFNLAFGARAACRDGRHAGDRYEDLGFRLALRSSSPDPEGGA